MNEGNCAGKNCYRCAAYACWHNMTEAMAIKREEANLLMYHKIHSAEDRLGRYGKNFDWEGK